MRSIKHTAIVCAVLVGLFADIARADSQKFQDGDRICFIGDSITKQGGYHAQILLFYVTRYPQMRLDTKNCGIAGDTAEGGVKRYDWDIAPKRPSVATIMMGMNDVRSGLYAMDKCGPQIEEQRKAAIEANIANMDKLAGRLSNDGAKIIIITPSLFDQTGNQQTDKLLGVNDALKVCAEADRTLAAKYNASLVDFNGPMEAINKEWQAKDATFTIVGGDRVHPGPVGHLVMAYLFLKEENLSPTVATMDIDATRHAVLKQEHCLISNLSASDESTSFECLENSLPFPVAPVAQRALEIIPFTNALNQEILRVSGLKEGPYAVWIDGKSVVKTTARNLKDGLNLAVIKETPQYKQATEVQQILNARADIEINQLRPLAQVNHWYLTDLKERTPMTEQKALDQQLEKLRSSKDKNSPYYISMIEAYRKYLPERESIERQISDLLEKAYLASKPKPHFYDIRPIGQKALGNSLAQ